MLKTHHRYTDTYLNSSINDPLFDGVFFDCACGHPKNASAFGDAAYAAGYVVAPRGCSTVGSQIKCFIY